MDFSRRARFACRNYFGKGRHNGTRSVPYEWARRSDAENAQRKMRAQTISAQAADPPVFVKLGE